MVTHTSTGWQLAYSHAQRTPLGPQMGFRYKPFMANENPNFMPLTPDYNGHGHVSRLYGHCADGVTETGSHNSDQLELLPNLISINRLFQFFCFCFLCFALAFKPNTTSTQMHH